MKRNTLGILLVLIGVGIGILGVALTQGEIADQNFLMLIMMLFVRDTDILILLVILFMKEPATWYLIWAGLILSGVGGIICAAD